MSVKVSAQEPDWSREVPRRFWDPSRKLIKTIRDYQRLTARPSVINKLRSKFPILRHRFWSVVAGADIPINCKFDGGLMLTHPQGVVIHPKAKIGPNCLILQQVTIVQGVEIGGNVDIGAGAKIIRSVKIGDHVQVGANAVVTKDIPESTIAVGIPAKVLKIKGED